MSLHNIIMAAAGAGAGPVKTFLPFNGANGSTSFPDLNGLNSFNVVGSGASISTTTPKWGTGSLRVPVGSWLHNNTAAPGLAGVFTWECWFKSVDNTKNHFIWCPQGTWYGSWSGGFIVNSTLGFAWAACVVGYTNVGGYKTGILPTVNTWTHLACTRDASNTWRFFVNGTLRANTRVAAIWNGNDWGPSLTDQPASSGWNIGQVGDGNYQGSGSSSANLGDSNFYIDDLKIVDGLCLYTSNFTPSRAPEST